MKRLKSDEKVTFCAPKVIFESLWGSKCHFFVTFGSLLNVFTKRGKSLFLVSFESINYFFNLGP